MKHLSVTLVFVIISVCLFGQTSLSYFNKGKYELDSKHFELAIEYFTKSIQLDAKNEMSYVDRALCRMTQGEWAKALPDCNKALAINPKQAVAYFVRGCAKANLKMNGCSDLKKSLQLGLAMAQKGIDQYCK